MQVPTLPRRSLIAWAAATVVLTPVAAAASIRSASPERSVPWYERGGLLFANHVPSRAKEASSSFASGVYAAVYEAKSESDRGWLIERWLCIAAEVGPDKVAVQTSSDAIFPSDNYHPVDVTLTVLESGDVEVAEDLLRGHRTTRWSRSGSQWELAMSKTVGVSGGVIYEEEYDRDQREVVISTSPISDDGPSKSTRHAVTEVFALAGYAYGPLV